jgi:heat shock protein HslJ
MKQFILLALTAVLLGACGGGERAASESGSATQNKDATMSGSETESGLAQLAGDWTLTEIIGTELPEGVPAPNLTVAADGMVSGRSGVNRFTGKLSDDSDVLFGPMATTRMAGPPAAMQLEDAFLKAMTDASSYTVNGDELVISAASGPLLRFER